MRPLFVIELSGRGLIRGTFTVLFWLAVAVWLIYLKAGTGWAIAAVAGLTAVVPALVVAARRWLR
jgi:hypothetical protein